MTSVTAIIGREVRPGVYIRTVRCYGTGKRACPPLGGVDWEGCTILAQYDNFEDAWAAYKVLPPGKQPETFREQPRSAKLP